MFGKYLPVITFLLLCTDTQGSGGGINFSLDLIHEASRDSFSSYGIQDEAQSPFILVLDNGAVQIGTQIFAPNLKLQVSGKIAASQYCNQSGIDCFSPESLGSGTPWVPVTGGYRYIGGSVGIGTSAPTYNFVINNGKARMSVGSATESRVTGTTHGRMYATTSTDDANRIYIYGGTRARFGTTRSRLYFVESATDWLTPKFPAFAILDNNRMGINTNNPQAIFEIVGVTDTDYLMLSSNHNNDGDLLIVDKFGNMGVGTSTPQATLDVNNVLRLSQNSASPSTCDALARGSMALTSGSRICICTGVSWVFSTDGSSACVW